MHLKTTTSERIKTTMASLNEDDSNGGGSGGGGGNGNSNSNNNNETNNTSSNQQQPMTDAGIKLKKQTLEQRKQELEKLLSEKSWLLQQIQKQETQILNGNYEYLNFNEILNSLAAQYKQEQLRVAAAATTSGNSNDAAILRRKHSSKENQNNINNNNNNNNNGSNVSNRQSEISNRSSEYDNYPPAAKAGDMNADGVSTGGLSIAIQQHAAKNALKKRTTPTTPIPVVQHNNSAIVASTSSASSNYNYLQLQRQHILQQHVEKQMLQKHLQQQQQLEQQQMLQQHLQYATLQQQASQHLKHGHYHQQQQLQQQHAQVQQRHYPAKQPTDAISLYSLNSANVATLRQQHVAPQQQPIIVQCDKYYLSPTHQSYNDGSGFIKSSQNIKKYISPMGSPTTATTVTATATAAAAASPTSSAQLAQHFMPLPQTPQYQQHHQQPTPHYQLQQMDIISLAPSYASIDAESLAQTLRWRSQSNVQHTQHSPSITNQDVKSHSSDMLSNITAIAAATPYGCYATNLKTKPLDEISISSLNSETNTQKKNKTKQWLESSLDGPIIRTQSAALDPQTLDISHAFINHNTHSSGASARLLAHTKAHARERTKLSSQSMSSARHYSMSSQKHHAHSNSSKLLQDDDGRYAKLSQSTSYLNSLENASTSISPAYHLDPDLVAFKYLPPKPAAISAPLPPPRPPPPGEKPLKPLTPLTMPVATTNNASVSTAAAAALSPEIRIESPQNMTVVQQATFQPYKEITKPFEMSDFYKYSTKFRQKDNSTNTTTSSNTNTTNNNNNTTANMLDQTAN